MTEATSITSVSVEAFRCFAVASRLDLSALPPGLHRVHGRNLTNTRLGSNGAGKSTLLSDAPTWCLYGRTVGGLRTTDVQSWLTEARPRVAVGIRRGSAEQEVARGPRATDLTIDGRAVGQADVNALVGVDLATWPQAVVWGQGQPLFLDLDASAKMELLSSALELERWERRAEAAGARARRLEERQRATEGEARGLAAARDHAREALSAAKSAAERWGREHAELLERAAQAARAARERAAALEGRRGEASLAAERAGMAARDAREAAVAQRRSAGERRREADRAAAELAQLRSTVEEAEAGLAAFSAAGKCPTCGQVVGKKDAGRHAREVRSRLAELRAELKRAVAAGAEVEACAAKLEEQLASEEGRLRDLEEAERGAEREEALLARELAGALAGAAAAEAAARQAAVEENPHREAAQAARARLREVDREIREREGLAGKLAASAERAKFWARGFREIRLSVIDDLLAELQEATADVLERLGVGEWEVRYSTERETRAGGTRRALAVEIRSPSAPAGVRWETYSGGERQRLRLAATAALSEVLLARAGASIDVRVLDEPTRGLSPEGIRDLVEMLSEYATSAGLRIFFVDHAAVESDRFASTVTVEHLEGSGAHLLGDATPSARKAGPSSQRRLKKTASRSRR